MEKSLFKTLWSFVQDRNELKSALSSINKHLQATFEKCVDSCIFFEDTANLLFEIDSIIYYLHDELNTGHWSKISIDTRRAFTAASFIKLIILLKNSTANAECLKCVDMGLLLGAPLQNSPELLTQCASHLSQNNEYQSDLNLNKRKLNNTQIYTDFNQIQAKEISTLSCPSLEHFNNNYFVPQLPAKLIDCMTHWPASKKWMDVNYLLKIAGNRTVPIEIGSHYTDQDWTQKLMPLKDFIQTYFLKNSNEIGYLAQHNLFDQIPELKNDIHMPEYCCLGDSDQEPDINAWFGPEGTVSPLHYDPKNNILCQVFGTKQLILFSPADTQFLYPHESKLLFNTSQVDPLKPQLDQFPNFLNAKMFKCLLEPGEMLFLPPKWWHHVVALDKSFSVSFWWE